IIPAYNRWDYVKETLRFLTAQCLPADICYEVIVVDDGSTDGTAAGLLQYGAQMPQLVCVRRERDDPSVFAPGRARNAGMRHSKGEVLCFLDAGMAVPPEYLAHVAARYQPLRDLVLLHYVFGLSARAARTPHVVDGLSPATFAAWTATSSHAREWLDTRD